jgi:beta-phosphoglucomutase-like phosphatase (HAD superfamily)
MTLPAKDCLVIEDAVSGILAAKRAGMTAWGLPTTCAAEELYQAGADRVLDQFEDLVCLLEQA